MKTRIALSVGVFAPSFLALGMSLSCSADNGGTRGSGGSSGSSGSGGSSSGSGGSGGAGGSFSGSSGSGGSGGAGAAPSGGSSGTGGAGAAGTGGTGGAGGTFGGSAGSGGAAGAAMGGAAGAAGTTPTTCTPTPATAVVLDDLEDGDKTISVTIRPLVGYWFAFGDGTGTLTPPAATWMPTAMGAGGSAFAACLQGTGFTGYGAGIGFNLMDLTTVKCPVDGTALTGVKFKIKGTGTVKVAVATKQGTSLLNGGTCALATGCDYDSFHALTPVELTAAFTEVTVPFATLMPGGTPFSKADLFAIKWQAFGATPVPPAVAAPFAFNFCVDDVSFY